MQLPGSVFLFSVVEEEDPIMTEADLQKKYFLRHSALADLLISKDANEERLRTITRCATQCFIVFQNLHAEGMLTRSDSGNVLKSQWISLISSYNTGIIKLYNIINILDVSILDKDSLIRMHNEINQLCNALMMESGQSTLREVDAIINKTLSTLNSLMNTMKSLNL